MVYKLRPHHLICLQFYQGLGYDENFVKNINKIAQNWEIFPVLVVEGPDDICISCPNLDNGRCKLGEENVQKKDEKAKEFLKIKKGDLIEKSSIRKRLYKFIERWFEECCTDCRWYEVCRRVYYNI